MIANAGFVVKTMQNKLMDFARLGIGIVTIVVSGITQQAQAWDDGTIGPYANPSQISHPSPPVSKTNDEIVQEICQRYNHCQTGQTDVGDAHRNGLIGYLNRRISFRRLENSRYSTPERTAEILALEQDIAKCKATEPIRGVGPLRRPIVADQVFLLGICEYYKHCSSNVIDTLHCYQLEHFLSLLKSEALKKRQTPEVELECKNLDLDLERLKSFGNKRENKLWPPPDLKTPAKSSKVVGRIQRAVSSPSFVHHYTYSPDSRKSRGGVSRIELQNMIFINSSGHFLCARWLKSLSK